MKGTFENIEHHPVVSREEWLTSRKELLKQEKEFTRQQDDLNLRRRELPWVRIEKTYEFDGSEGQKSLTDLFGSNSQLIIQHFMFGPGWEEGCTGCSFLADHVDAANQHLAHHDVSVVAISRAPFSEIARYKRRMGWKFPWLSSYGSDFNYDFHVSFTLEQRASGRAYANYTYEDPEMDEISGHSVFYRDEGGAIFHTYSTFSRGGESLIGTYSYLDLMPKGRNENGPQHNLMDWVKRHDRYDDNDNIAGLGKCCSETE